MYLNQSHNSPYWAQPRPQLAFLILIMLWMPRSPFADLGWWALLPMLAIVGGVLWWTLSPDGRSGVLRTMQRLQKDVHWFQLRPVTCHELGDGDELRTALTKHGYQVIELDGQGITSWQSLGEALQPHTAPLRFPEEPRNHVRALLAQMACEKPRRRAIVWRNAIVAAQHDPAFFARVLADQASQALTLPAGLLLFVDLPEAAPQPRSERDVEMRLPHGEPRDVDRGVLTRAPDDAWWKPKPGEMTHG